MRAFCMVGLALSTTWGVALPAAAEVQSAPLEQLLETARHWEARGRDDRANEAWLKVLRTDPGHVGALLAVGLYSARRGEALEARTYLDRLVKVAPAHPGVGQLEQAIAVGRGAESILGRARQRAKAGDPAGAVAAYRELFGTEPPPRHLALEYYQTLGGAPGGWGEARAGLARLVALNPSAENRLVLARHLTYREEGRREGLSLLAELEEDPGVGKEASVAQRQGLLWLNAAPADLPFFSAWLQRHPGDQEIEARLAALQEGKAGPEVLAGFEALRRSDVKAAKGHFKTAGSSAEALVGQALVALRTEDFATARRLLMQVRTEHPDRPDLWEKPLHSANFWATMREAEADRVAGRLDRAAATLNALERTGGAEAFHATQALAFVELERGRYAEAEIGFERLLARDPASAAALRGMVEVLLRTGRFEESVARNEKLAKLAPEQAYGPHWIASERLRLEAADRRRAADLPEALAMLQAANQVDPDNLWVLFDLANLQIDLGDAVAAAGLLGQLQAKAPGMKELLLLQLRLHAADGAFAAALDRLDQLDPAQLSPELLRWRERLEVQVEIQRILSRAELDGHEARLMLMRLQWKIQRDPELLIHVAAAWARLGEGEKVATAVEAILLHGDLDPSLRLLLASLLLEAGRDAELVGLLRQLSREESLTGEQKKSLQELRVGHAIRSADRLREARAFDRAFVHLSSLLTEFPDDPALLCAMGRLYRSGGRERDAHAVFLLVLRSHPDHLEARQAAVETAVAIRAFDDAERLNAEGLERSPNDPRLRLSAGRLAVAAGKPRQGMEDFRRALRLASGTSGDLPEWADTGSQQQLTGSSGVEDVLRVGATRFGATGAADRSRGAARQQQLLDEIGKEIDGLNGRLGVGLGGAGELRLRDGEPGFGQLMELRIPLELKVPLGYSGSLAFQLVPVALSSGSLDGDLLTVASRYGSGFGAPVGDQAAAGTEIGLVWQSDGLRVDLGSTPLGFPLQTAVGGLEWSWEGGGLGLRLDLSRRAVKDSMLSYAGLENEGTTWGGVVKQGARLDLAFIGNETLFYLTGGVHLLTGVGVPENHVGSGGAGLEWTIHDLDGQRVSTGLGVHGMGYAENQRYYTLGHGGYFSPQAFVRAGIPIKWAGSHERLGWEILLDPGVNWFREAEAKVFPDSPGRQASAEAAGGLTRYAGRTAAAFSFNGEPRFSYEVSDRMKAGLRVGFYTAEEYREISAGLFVEGTLAPQAR